MLDLFTSVLAPAVIRADSPRFLAWIPSAPTKASMLFDAVVSLASISGVSWIESAGAVWAENEALRFIADLAGMPVTAGGTFVQGGSAANLSALAVARDAGRRRLGDPRRRLQFAVTDDTHSSVRNTMHLLDVDPLLVPLVNDRLTGDALAATLETCADPSLGVRGRRQRREHQRRARRRPRRRRPRSATPAVCGCTSTPHTAVARSSRRRPGPSFAGIERSDSLVVDPHKWLYAPLDCAALLYRDPDLARSVHGQHAAYLDSVNDERDAWNPGDYAYQLDAARPRPAVLVLARGLRHRRVPHRGGARARPHPCGGRPHPRSPPPRARARARAVGRPVPAHGLGHRAVRRVVAAAVPRPGRTRRPHEWKGETVARLAFLHPRTTLEIVDEILATTI